MMMGNEDKPLMPHIPDYSESGKSIYDHDNESNRNVPQYDDVSGILSEIDIVLYEDSILDLDMSSLLEDFSDINYKKSDTTVALNIGFGDDFPNIDTMAAVQKMSEFANYMQTVERAMMADEDKNNKIVIINRNSFTILNFLICTSMESVRVNSSSCRLNFLFGNSDNINSVVLSDIFRDLVLDESYMTHMNNVLSELFLSHLSMYDRTVRNDNRFGIGSYDRIFKVIREDGGNLSQYEFYGDNDKFNNLLVDCNIINGLV